MPQKWRKKIWQDDIFNYKKQKAKGKKQKAKAKAKAKSKRQKQITKFQKRSNSSEKRLENAIDSKGKKLNQVVKAEETLDAKKEQNDASKLQNLSLQYQVNFSTLTLNIYQDESIKQEMVANEKSINAYRPNIGLQIWDSLKTGWFMLENIISFVIVLWPFALIGFLGFLGYKKFLK